MDTQELHRRSLQEISELRRANEILAAKVEVFELCASMVHARAPERRGGAINPDIAHELSTVIGPAPGVAQALNELTARYEKLLGDKMVALEAELSEYRRLVHVLTQKLIARRPAAVSEPRKRR